jgi:hypothetical protein
MPRKLIDEPDFRIVETEVGGNVLHVLEVRDGVDAMENEKWRQFRTDNKDLRTILSYMVRIALELETERGKG